jgi:mannose-6-phosphate isomerase-like protein (cupin superfamily)
MTEVAVKPQTYRVRTQLLSEGRSDRTIARTDLMTVRIKCYAQGGENALHTHRTEDHTFVVLQGKARFWDGEGNTQVLGRNEGILQPRGAFYKFESCGDEPLVLLRVGATTGEAKGEERVTQDGRPIPGNSAENLHVEPVYIEGAYYE